MLYALDQENKKIKAIPLRKGRCPICNSILIPKCGNIKVWHWSHLNKNDCDTWSEGETDWHLGWKKEVKPEYCEVKVGNHRADIKNNFGVVIELQNSSISTETIIEREKYYGAMVWLFNGKDFNIELKTEKIDDYNSFLYDISMCKKFYMSFRWKHPRKTLWFCDKPIFIDLGRDNLIVEIKKIYCDIPCGGWGYLIKKDIFIKRFMGCITNEKV